jgi:hypothetical protein
MIAKRMIAALAASALFACSGCTSEELAAMSARAAGNADAGYQFPDSTFPPPPPPATTSDTPGPPLISQALDPSSGHVLISIAPGLYMDPTNGAVFPPGTAIPLGPQ